MAVTGGFRSLFALALLAAMPAGAAEWRSTADSKLVFEARIEGVSTPGRFGDFDVDFGFDPDQPENARLEVVVELASADFGDPDMNAVLFDPAWFDVTRFARANFASTKIAPLGDGRFVAAGVLDLKGVARSVEVPFAWQSSAGTATMRGEFVLSRNDFNVGSGEWAGDDPIGDDVKLIFDVRLERIP